MDYGLFLYLIALKTLLIVVCEVNTHKAKRCFSAPLN